MHRILLAVTILPALIGGAAAARDVERSSGGAIDQVKIVRGTDAIQTNGNAFVPLAPAHATITVPPGQNAVLIVQFSAQSMCYDLTVKNPNFCALRISALESKSHLVVGSFPSGGNGQDAFDTTNHGRKSAAAPEVRSIDRSSTVGPGTYVVQIEWRVTEPTTTFQLDDWQLTVMTAPVPK